MSSPDPTSPKDDSEPSSEDTDRLIRALLDSPIMPPHLSSSSEEDSTLSNIIAFSLLNFPSALRSEPSTSSKPSKPLQVSLPDLKLIGEGSVKKRASKSGSSIRRGRGRPPLSRGLSRRGRFRSLTRPFRTRGGLLTACGFCLGRFHDSIENQWFNDNMQLERNHHFEIVPRCAEELRRSIYYRDTGLNSAGSSSNPGSANLNTTNAASSIWLETVSVSDNINSAASSVTLTKSPPPPIERVLPTSEERQLEATPTRLSPSPSVVRVGPPSNRVKPFTVVRGEGSGMSAGSGVDAPTQCLPNLLVNNGASSSGEGLGETGGGETDSAALDELSISEVESVLAVVESTDRVSSNRPAGSNIINRAVFYEHMLVERTNRADLTCEAQNENGGGGEIPTGTPGEEIRLALTVTLSFFHSRHHSYGTNWNQARWNNDRGYPICYIPIIGRSRQGFG